VRARFRLRVQEGKSFNDIAATRPNIALNFSVKGSINLRGG